MAQQGYHGGTQHEGQLDQLVRQEVAIVVVQAGQLRHLHQPEDSFQMNQEEQEAQGEKKKVNKEEEGNAGVKEYQQIT